MNYIELSDAVEQGLATCGWNEKPEGWRTASFKGLMAYVSPECPPINGEDMEDC